MAEFVTEHPDRFRVARVVRGDEAAFGEFFESHFAPLFRFAMPRVANDAEVAAGRRAGGALPGGAEVGVVSRGGGVADVVVHVLPSRDQRVFRKAQPRAVSGVDGYSFNFDSQGVIVGHRHNEVILGVVPSFGITYSF
jgi:hypothetical protein